MIRVSCHFDIRFAEVITREEQRLPERLGQCIGEAVR